MQKINLKSNTLEELESVIISFGEKKYRAVQLFHVIHKQNIDTIKDIAVLPKILRNELAQKYFIGSLRVEKRFDSQLDGTKKYLFRLHDDHLIESVLMKYKHGYSACLSTQVGCRMGCLFCASTKGGLVRDLTAGEIADQVYQMQKDSSVRISNIVLMGSGEPLENYENVIKFLSIIHNEHGQNMGYRHITLSTVGIPDKIRQLADEALQITLSISLHAPDDELRKQIVPVARKYSIQSILDACKYYLEKTHRRITFEYALIQNLNDAEEQARQFAGLLKGLLCHVNLIPMNSIKESNLRPTSQKQVQKFHDVLESKGINVTIRRELGGDINAACGQLRRDYYKDS
ncbi:MAG TPA: 23S rRNA (adenine(2503)-C(2))-methyltransferase RlmN [Candidatus Cloacimonetes bacterium]|nr:23S rRNA (adenine(2503)-C(2))-methyltransferase RlmN [Candidatus Cloacimonadota bacterium]HEX37586.1 23S rRNA (adenine(2503)-C(2))-methyltransferase RlmN [Candidatus Cloacimonadota bacterium]